MSSENGTTPPADGREEVRCYGCGSAWTDEDLRAEKAEDPKILSCCPERKPLNIDQWMDRALTAERALALSPQTRGAEMDAMIERMNRALAKADYEAERAGNLENELDALRATLPRAQCALATPSAPGASTHAQRPRE